MKTQYLIQFTLAVFVAASKQVTEIRRRFVTGYSLNLPAYSSTNTIDDSCRNIRFPELKSFWPCIEKCEYAFAANAAQIIRLNAQIENETNVQRRQFLVMRLETRKSRAKRVLQFYLSCYSKPLEE